MRLKPVARKVTQGSSGDELEIQGVSMAEDINDDSIDSLHQIQPPSSLQVIPIPREPAVTNESAVSPSRGRLAANDNAPLRKPKEEFKMEDIIKLNNATPNESYKDHIRIRSSEMFVQNNLKNSFNFNLMRSDISEAQNRLANEMQRLRSRDILLPMELECRPYGAAPDVGVWARGNIARGTKYGPFLGKWAGEPMDRRHAWEVVAGTGVRGWLDGSLEPSNWLKHIRVSTSPHHANMQHLLVAGQLWYEASRDIPAGSELVLPPRGPLQLRDMFAEPGLQDDRSDRETGSQHSGTVEDDREGDREEDEEETTDTAETRCIVCDKQCSDIEQLDEHLVSSHRYPVEQYRCDLCPRAYAYRPCLIRHRAVAHGDLRKYPCENCSKVFTDPSNLQRHIRAHHVGARSHACPECGKTFATSSGLKQHTHIHSSVKPFQCEVCFKAYTQFSNLCRHKRMHADCRMQIKCVKCGQSFSTVTSLSKHKRFCDSTNQAPPQNHPIQSSSIPNLPNMSNMQMNNNQNPFLMYPRPNLPFFPPNFPHYPSLFHHGGHSPYLNNPLLFPQPQTIKEEEAKPEVTSSDSRKRRSSSTDRISPIEQLSFKTKDRFTPPRHTGLSSKVSPPTAEEASSNTRPSPARPLISSSSVFNNPRDCLTLNSSGNNEISTSDDDDSFPRDLSRGSVDNKRHQPTDKKEIRTKSESSEDNSEQPLDLRVERKRARSESLERADSIKSRTPTPPIKQEEIVVEKIVPKSETTASPQMAYPRPIHPMFLEAMYRPQFPAFAQSERLLPPPPHFGHSRSFPLPFGSLVNGHNRPPFDLLRPQIPGFTKPFQEILSAHSGKLKDRYACKFCGKVFPRSANLTRHLRTHTGEQPYKCKYCERSFSISSNLQRHVRNIHNKEKPFKCPLCERCFGQQTNLDRHLKKHETEDGSSSVVVADSPGSSNENEREDAYFDEIRSFMGKVTYSGPEAYSQYYNHRLVDVVSEDLEDEEDTDGAEEIDVILKSDKEESLNNNETIEVAT